MANGAACEGGLFGSVFVILSLLTIILLLAVSQTRLYFSGSPLIYVGFVLINIYNMLMGI